MPDRKQARPKQVSDTMFRWCRSDDVSRGETAFDSDDSGVSDELGFVQRGDDGRVDRGDPAGPRPFVE